MQLWKQEVKQVNGINSWGIGNPKARKQTQQTKQATTPESKYIVRMLELRKKPSQKQVIKEVRNL